MYHATITRKTIASLTILLINNLLLQGINSRKILRSHLTNYSKCYKFLSKREFPSPFIGVIDVVIPCHPKDIRTLPLVIKGIQDNCSNIRRIIIVSTASLTDQAEWFDEHNYPFTQKDLALIIFNNNMQQAQIYLEKPNNRIGWIYQQLLKFYAPLIIPNISSSVLIVDADTIFLNPVSFTDIQNNLLYNPGTEYHRPYFEHLKKLAPGISRVFPQFSGISHHMLLQRSMIENLFAYIKQHHNTEPWVAICKCISQNELNGSCFSEYETYFNFSLLFDHRIKVRSLKWANIPFDLQAISKHKKEGFHYVSCHSYL